MASNGMALHVMASKSDVFFQVMEKKQKNKKTRTIDF